MSRAYLAFTEKGMALAHRLARALPGSVSRCGAGGVRLAEWTSTQFAQADALIFVGAVGIAVRAIAPHCKSKATDPAVVVLDECGRFAVPLLSGHLGGANALARALAEACGAIPVITTATDANGVFAVDEWAKAQGCAVLEPERIKLVSGALLAGHTVRLASDWPVQGTSPREKQPRKRCIWYPVSGCWAWAASGEPQLTSWKRPLRLFVPPMALPRRASAAQPALI